MFIFWSTCVQDGLISPLMGTVLHYCIKMLKNTEFFYRKWNEINYQLTSAFVFCWYAKSISVHVQIIDRNMNRTNNIHSLFWWKCFFEMKYSQYSIISLSSWIAENVANTHIYNFLSNSYFWKTFFIFCHGKRYHFNN